MITIDREASQIVFQNDFSEMEDPKPIHRKELISCYICPKCEEILSAYFRTDIYIKVWEYDENEQNNKSCDSDIRHYKYRIFYANGAMGIEHKEHNRGYEDKCSYSYIEAFSLIYSINSIVKALNEQLEEDIFNPIKSIADREKLIKTLSKTQCFGIIHDVCQRGEPLVHFNIKKISFKETDYWKCKGEEYEQKKNEEINNKKMAFDSIYQLLLC